MKTASRGFGAASALVVVLALPAKAYEPKITHPTLTAASVEKSALVRDPSLLFRLGRPPTPSTQKTIRETMERGSTEEDVGTRAFNHFYDPIHERPLTVVVPLGRKSWQWMLELPDPSSNQERSIADAHMYLKTALTYNEGTPGETEKKRKQAMDMVFLSLGSAVHHMQDMAQPQHVRNDQHLDEYPFLGPLFRPSLYERYTAKKEREDVEALCKTASAAFPEAAHLKTAGDFWFNPDEGIAQYTSRHFVSTGTNFKIFRGQANADGAYPQPLPEKPTDVTIEKLYKEPKDPIPAEIRSLCGLATSNCTMTMYATKTSTRASTLSIFDQDLKLFHVDVTYVGTDITPPTYKVDRLFALNRFNFDDAHPVLISKAVSYSAGIINHFFRGKFEVTAPETGPYAVVDHATGNGFRSLRASVTNATPGEALPTGSLMAIARFHRNHCYKPDLSGEFTETDTGALVTPCAEYRSSEEHIRVSTPLTTSFRVGEKKKDITFQFNTEIPLDATDLVLQVYYQKTDKALLKEEMFAVGAVDISEPTFVAVMNATDVFDLGTSTGGQFFYYPDIIKNIAYSPYSIIDTNHDQTYGIPPDVDVSGGDIYYRITIDGQNVGETVVPEGRFARLAVLSRLTGLDLEIKTEGNNFNNTDFYDFNVKTSQWNLELGSFVVSTVGQVRNHTLQFNAVVYFHYYPYSSALLKNMPRSKAKDATELVEFSNTDLPLWPRLAAPFSRQAGITGIQSYRNPSFIIQTDGVTRRLEKVAPAAPAP